jgi:hypothetical protein
VTGRRITVLARPSAVVDRGAEREVEMTETAEMLDLARRSVERFAADVDAGQRAELGRKRWLCAEFVADANFEFARLCRMDSATRQSTQEGAPKERQARELLGRVMSKLISLWLSISQVLLGVVDDLEAGGEPVAGADQLRKNVQEVKQALHGFDLAAIDESLAQAERDEFRPHEDVFARRRGR